MIYQFWLKFMTDPKLVIIGLILYFVSWKCWPYYFPNISYIDTEIKVIDGDTIIVGKVKIRLAGIDAPELEQNCSKEKCGQKAKAFLLNLTSGKKVECSDEGVDKYGRTLSYCFVDKISINAAMIESGNAVIYGLNGIMFYPQELKARYGQKGLWRNEFILPSKWRKINSQKD